jgi:hypothetical protein
LHALLLVVSLWSVAWAVALRSATRHVDHVLDSRTLTLAIGFKRLARIPLTAIDGVQVIDHQARRSGDDWLDNHGLKPREVSVLASLDKPTLLITLKDDTPGAWCTCNGRHRPLRRQVAVYADEPAVMQHALAAALPSA